MTEKRCSKCGETKPVSEFNINRTKKDGLQTACRPCGKKHANQYYYDEENYSRIRKQNNENKTRRINENRIKVFKYLKVNTCKNCPETDPVVLEFDHRDGVNKIDSVSKMISNGKSWESIKAEIAKCDVLCANCHRRRTAKQQDWYKRIL